MKSCSYMIAADENALAGVKGVGDDGVALFGQLLDAGRLLVEGVVGGDAVGHVVGHVEDVVGGGVEELLAHGPVHVLLLDLAVLVEVGLLDDVGHAGLHDLKAVFLQIVLDVVVGAGVEV